MLLKLLVLATKVLMVLVMLYVSSTYHLSVILLVILAWYVWLLMVSPEPRKRLIATTGFALTIAGYWSGNALWHYFAVRVEMSHISEDGRYWAGLGVASQQAGTVLTLSGLLALAYSDYLRSPRSKQIARIHNSEDTDKNQVWPPAPKQP
jgi:hypothetical protein